MYISITSFIGEKREKKTKEKNYCSFRYMTPPQPHSRKIEQPSPSFGEARSILSRAQDQLGRLEKEQRSAGHPGSVNTGYNREPDVYPVPHKHRTRSARTPAGDMEMSELPRKQSRELTQADIAHAERQQLEAQLLVSKALARARAGKKGKRT